MMKLYGNTVSLGDTNVTAEDDDGIFSGTITTTNTVIGAAPTETSLNYTAATTVRGAESTYNNSGEHWVLALLLKYLLRLLQVFLPPEEQLKLVQNISHIQVVEII